MIHIRAASPPTHPSARQNIDQSMDHSNRSTSSQPCPLISKADIQMLEIILRGKNHDQIYKQSTKLLITLLHCYVRFGVDHGLFEVEHDFSTESVFTGIEILIAAIESNQATVVNWLTSRIKDQNLYNRAILAIGKSQDEESEIMFLQALRRGSQAEMIFPGLVTDSLRTIVYNAAIHSRNIAQSAQSKSALDRLMRVTEHLAIKKLELLFSYSVQSFGWPGSLFEFMANDGMLNELPSYLETTYLDFCGIKRCYILP
jgi:hypothetical protein